MRSRIVAALLGLLLAYAFVISLSLASGFFLSTARLETVLKEEFSQSALGSLSRFDQWIECAILTMQLSRHEDVVLNALDTRWRSPQQHTCDEAQALLQGPPYKIKIAEPSSYVSYPFGARHLQSLMINIFSFSTTMAIYQFLTYASVVSLFIGAWRNSKRTASLVVSPIVLALLFAFEQHRFGSNTPWAPGFFISFLILSMFLAVREFFWRRETHRIAFFCFLGTIAGYFDNLHGPLPVVLSLTIVLNHFFYSENDSWISALRSASIISACFVISYGLLTIIRLWPLGWLLADSLDGVLLWLKFQNGQLSGRTHYTNNGPSSCPLVGAGSNDRKCVYFRSIAVHWDFDVVLHHSHGCAGSTWKIDMARGQVHRHFCLGSCQWRNFALVRPFPKPYARSCLDDGPNARIANRLRLRGLCSCDVRKAAA